ncbi:hypothetical protein [Labilibaculum antarcticum]|uniref:Uncharacterized protein n=1 Tax=Labilibaculum antarcticum TaxID=1717717 RepID=A0A1Y1CNU8_9BACT|nr:hypothetical protein [Labilibaculum antarcticum]BAX81944.1 hypothetical protein ALGA_3652 [Labilibaculum antarcticum]
MSELQNYQDSLEEIQAVTREAVKHCNLPFEIFIHEAKKVCNIAEEDIAVLAPLGLQQEKIERCNVLTGALLTAELNWENQNTERKEAMAKWKADAPKMNEQISDMYATMRFAYRNNQRLLAILDTISEGDSNADAVMDLARLGSLAKENPEPLQAISYDMEQCNTALTEAERMSALLAEVNGNMYVDDEKKVIRDKAYTLVKVLVDEIREYGKFAFRKDEDHVRLYASKYQRDRKAEYRRTKIENEVDAEQA